MPSSAPQVRQVPQRDEQVIKGINQNLSQLTDYKNQKLNSEEINGRLEEKNTIKVFHFWASWCEPCLNELPDFIAFVQKQKNRNAASDADYKNIKKYFFIVSLDYDEEGLKKFAKIFPEILSQNFIQIWDKENILSQQYGIEKLPATMIVYPDSHVKLHNGAIEWKKFEF